MMSLLLQYLESHIRDMVADLEVFAQADSPSTEKDRTDQCGRVLLSLFQKRLGIEGEILPQESVGNHLRLTCGTGDEQILILGHFDTVWVPGRLGIRKEGNRLYGPGVLDMKGGIIQALWAVRALRDQGLFPHRRKVVFFLNSDEEIGSKTSRGYIEQEAARSRTVLVVEPAEARTGALKTARKGVGMFHLAVKGRSSHAGNHHDQGVSAVLELARQIQVLESMTNYETGTTVNVGWIRGGTRSNVVPEYAEAEIDVRVTSFPEAERILHFFEHLRPLGQGVSVKVTGELNRPPMPRTEVTAGLFEKAREIASRLGFDLREASVGGASDGNFTAAMGVPTLDGLGAVGDGPHAEHEHILIDEMPRRAALLGHLIAEL